MRSVPTCNYTQCPTYKRMPPLQPAARLAGWQANGLPHAARACKAVLGLQMERRRSCVQRVKVGSAVPDPKHPLCDQTVCCVAGSCKARAARAVSSCPRSARVQSTPLLCFAAGAVRCTTCYPLHVM